MKPLTVEEAKDLLRARAKEARKRALEFDRDPVEDLAYILPEDLPLEAWREIIAESYP